MANGVKRATTHPNKRVRRASAMHRLEQQLKSGTKTSKEGVVPLSDGDVSRIQKEILVLKSRV